MHFISYIKQQILILITPKEHFYEPINSAPLQFRHFSFYVSGHNLSNIFQYLFDLTFWIDSLDIGSIMASNRRHPCTVKPANGHLDELQKAEIVSKSR